jgi:transcriptional regulator with XRE-family HTH domain
MITLKTEADVLLEVSAALRTHRLALGLRQIDLAEKSGIAVDTLRRFERTGNIGFIGFAKLLVSLGLVDSFLHNFRPQPPPAKTMRDFLAVGKKAKVRRRARAPRSKG